MSDAIKTLVHYIEASRISSQRLFFGPYYWYEVLP